MFSGLEGQIRRRNLIGIATDGSSNMISKKDKGVTNRFQQDLPYLLVTHDFCHCFNLILQSCIDKFPTKYVKMVKQIVSVFSQSPQKTAILKRLIRNDPERRNKIEGMKKYVKNRWTSFQDCLERILQLIEPLRQFFSEEGDSNQSTYLQKNDVLMLRLLFCFMNKLNYYIKLFHEDNLDTIKIVRTLKQAFVTLGNYVFKLDTSEYSQPHRKHAFLDYDVLFQEISEIPLNDTENIIYQTKRKDLCAGFKCSIYMQYKFTCSIFVKYLCAVFFLMCRIYMQYLNAVLNIYMQYFYTSLKVFKKINYCSSFISQLKFQTSLPSDKISLLQLQTVAAIKILH